jgi:hypothetical protein
VDTEGLSQTRQVLAALAPKKTSLVRASNKAHYLSSGRSHSIE